MNRNKCSRKQLSMKCQQKKIKCLYRYTDKDRWCKTDIEREKRNILEDNHNNCKKYLIEHWK